jgi:hypothetical protein
VTNGDGQMNGDSVAPDAGTARQRLLARKVRRMERRAARRRRGLEGEEAAGAAGAAAAAAGTAATTEQLPAAGEADEAEPEEGEEAVPFLPPMDAPDANTMVDPLPPMDATDAGAVVEPVLTAAEGVKDSVVAALWDLSAFVGEAAEAAAAEAPALDIKTLRLPVAASEESLSLSTMGAGKTAKPIDRHGINPPSTIAPVTKLGAPLPETLDYSTEDNPYNTEAVGEVQVRLMIYLHFCDQYLLRLLL